MSASLVGSEMCIRDRVDGFGKMLKADGIGGFYAGFVPILAKQVPYTTVSYTHLTLPTICSV
eukprot:7979406-Alexandrium_andersonii.AAC.1